MARLAGEVEKEILPAHEARQLRPVAHVGNVNVHVPGNAREITAIPAVFRGEAVYDRNTRTQGHKLAGKRRTDEPKPSRNEDPLPGIYLA